MSCTFKVTFLYVSDFADSLSPFNTQPFVLTAVITSSCSTRKGSVPEMYTPSSWRWPMRKYDLWPLWRLLIAQPVFCFWGDRRTLVALGILTNCKRDWGEGRTETEADSAKMNMWKRLRGLQTFVSHRLLRIASMGQRWSIWLTNQTLEKRGKVFFGMNNTPLFKMSSEEFYRGRWLFLIT